MNNVCYASSHLNSSKLCNLTISISKIERKQAETRSNCDFCRFWKSVPWTFLLFFFFLQYPAAFRKSLSGVDNKATHRLHTVVFLLKYCLNVHQ